MQLIINLTKEQYYYLKTESEKQGTTKEELIKQFIDIQIELQSTLEDDINSDLWNTSKD